MTIFIAPRSSSLMTYDNAILYCFFLEHNGYTDWRMPTSNEYYRNSIQGSWFMGEPHDSSTKWYVTPVRTE